MDGWRSWSRKLAAELVKAGVLTDPVWRRIVEDVPRHLFVPGVPEETAYSDDTLVTQRIEYGGYDWPTSSSTAPSLMFRMLHELELLEGMSVLEIGLGTGYNAALLSERLTARNVVSLDIDPVVVDNAREALESVGYAPVTECRDGREGYIERAPFDRVIATVAFESIPYTWVEQVRVGGLIVADLRTPGAPWTGALVRLSVLSDGVASGRFLPLRHGFMSARTDYRRPGLAETPALNKLETRSRTTSVAGEELEQDGFGLLVWTTLGPFSAFPATTALTLVTEDGSWAELPRNTSGRLVFGGPTDLWSQIESLHASWLSQGRPGIDRYGLTVSAKEQTVWLDSPERTVGRLHC